MDDPYKVLGVKPGASEDEIRRAYHELVKKYHPDKYQNNPLADLAEEKLREVNEAYDAIMNKGGFHGSYGGQSYGPGSSRGYSGGYSGSAYSGSGYAGTGHTAASPEYNAIRDAINRRDFVTAEQLLINHKTHDAEWYFLSGVMSFSRGYVDDGLANVRQAMQMAPSNYEYQQMYTRMTQGGNIYRNMGNGQGYGGADLCTQCLTCYCCSSLISPCW